MADGVDLTTLPDDGRFSTIEADDKRPPSTPFRAIEPLAQPRCDRRVDQLHRVRQQSVSEQSLSRFYGSLPTGECRPYEFLVWRHRTKLEGCLGDDRKGTKRTNVQLHHIIAGDVLG